MIATGDLGDGDDVCFIIRLLASGCEYLRSIPIDDSVLLQDEPERNLREAVAVWDERGRIDGIYTTFLTVNPSSAPPQCTPSLPTAIALLAMTITPQYFVIGRRRRSRRWRDGLFVPVNQKD
jgi:hypothetical protein